AARALWRRHLPDARRRERDARSQDARALRAILADAAASRPRAHEALQARVGPDRLGVCRPAPAVREVLRRRLVHHPQPQLPRGAVEGFREARRRRDGELRRARERRGKESGLIRFVLLLAALVPTLALAQPWPSKPLRMVV